MALFQLRLYHCLDNYFAFRRAFSMGKFVDKRIIIYYSTFSDENLFSIHTLANVKSSVKIPLSHWLKKVKQKDCSLTVH